MRVLCGIASEAWDEAIGRTDLKSADVRADWRAGFRLGSAGSWGEADEV